MKESLLTWALKQFWSWVYRSRCSDLLTPKPAEEQVLRGQKHLERVKGGLVESCKSQGPYHGAQWGPQAAGSGQPWSTCSLVSHVCLVLCPPVFQDPNKRFGASLGALSGGRISITRMGLNNLKLALAVAIRYSATRRQFGPKDTEEIPVLEYQLQVSEDIIFYVIIYMFEPPYAQVWDLNLRLTCV